MITNCRAGSRHTRLFLPGRDVRRVRSRAKKQFAARGPRKQGLGDNKSIWRSPDSRRVLLTGVGAMIRGSALIVRGSVDIDLQSVEVVLPNLPLSYAVRAGTGSPCRGPILQRARGGGGATFPPPPPREVVREAYSKLLVQVASLLID